MQGIFEMKAVKLSVAHMAVGQNPEALVDQRK